jgi:hypothetical protein
MTQLRYALCLGLFLMVLFCASCTNFQRAISTQKLSAPEQPVDNFLILFVEYRDEIVRLDEEYYNKALKGKFNNLEHQRFRDHMADVAWDIYLPVRTFDYRNIFEGHKDYAFNDFQARLDQPNLNYILLINMKNNDNIGEELRRNFQVYLFDKNLGQPIWTGVGYHNPGKLIRTATARRLLNRIKKDLIVEGIINN